MNLYGPTDPSPTQPGYFLFNGARKVRAANYEHLHEPVGIIRYVNGTKTELAVVMFGRLKRFHLDSFCGSWKAILVEEE